MLINFSCLILSPEDEDARKTKSKNKFKLNKRNQIIYFDCFGVFKDISDLISISRRIVIN